MSSVEPAPSSTLSPAEVLPRSELPPQLRAAARVEVPARRRVHDGVDHALARSVGALVAHHARDAGLLGDGEVVFVVRLGGPHPARGEQLHAVSVDDRGSARAGLVAQVVAEHPQHRLGTLERRRRVDVDPAHVAHVHRHERAAIGQRAHAVGQRAVAVLVVEPREFFDQRRTDPEDAGVESVVALELLADVRDPASGDADLGCVVDVEAALDVVVDAERAGARGNIDGQQAAHELGRVQVVRHRQQALAVDEVGRGEQRHAVLRQIALVVHEAELEAQARLGDQRGPHGLALVPDDDDGLANARGLQRTQHPHQQRDLSHRAQRLRRRIAALTQARAGTGCQDDGSGHSSVSHRGSRFQLEAKRAGSTTRCANRAIPFRFWDVTRSSAVARRAHCGRLATLDSASSARVSSSRSARPSGETAAFRASLFGCFLLEQSRCQPRGASFATQWGRVAPDPRRRMRRIAANRPPQ